MRARNCVNVLGTGLRRCSRGQLRQAEWSRGIGAKEVIGGYHAWSVEQNSLGGDGIKPPHVVENARAALLWF